MHSLWLPVLCVFSRVLLAFSPTFLVPLAWAWFLDRDHHVQVWALGFMFAVETWGEDWAPPRDRDLAASLDESLTAIVALTEDDTGAPEVAPFGDGPASVSQARVNDLADAIWAAYDLRAIARELGPRIATVRAAPTPGRNEACPCGSGKKYKKCHGA